MQINFYPNNLRFTSNSGFYKTEDGNSIGTTTKMFRADLNWKDFTNFMIKHFNHKDNVQILQFASSDGSEAYTQIISLLENNKATDKFFPIEAYDINEDIYRAASSGYINLNNKDKSKFVGKKIDFDKYFEKENISEANKIAILHDKLENSEAYKVRPILTDRVNFHHGDMFKVMLEHEDNGNTVVLCRNILNYFSDRDLDRFVTTAAWKLKPRSLLVTGEIDRVRVDDVIQRNGFLKLFPNVYMKF